MSSYESNERFYVCTLCPNGCDLTVTKAADGTVDVQGARCKKGIEYGTKEVVDPERVLTTTVKVAGGTLPTVPVRSCAPMKKTELRETIALLDERCFEAPIAFGQILVQNVGKNKVDIMATAAMERG